MVDIGGRGIEWKHNEGGIGDHVEMVNGARAVRGKSYLIPDKGLESYP